MLFDLSFLSSGGSLSSKALNETETKLTNISSDSVSDVKYPYLELDLELLS